MLRPRMKATLTAAPSTEGADLGLVLAASGVDIRVVRGDVGTLAALFGLLSGAYTVSEIAARAGLSEPTVSRVVSQLAAHGLVYDYAVDEGDRAVDRRQFVELFTALATALRVDMLRHELFQQVAVSEPVFLAAAVEYFHVIRDAGAHASIAAAHAPPELVPLLQSYCESERDHHLAIGAAIQGALGGTIDLGDLAPLASTESLLLKTRQLARQDTLAYVASCAFAEARQRAPLAATLDSARGSWRPASLALLDAFVGHAREDHDADHADLFAAAVHALRGDISSRRAARVLDEVHAVKHYFDNMNAEIVRRHRAPGATLPRLRGRLLDYVAADE